LRWLVVRPRHDSTGYQTDLGSRRITMYCHFMLATFMLAAMFAALVLTSTPAAARTTPFSFTYDVTDEPDTSCGFLVLRDDVGKAMGRASDSRFDITNTGIATLTNPDNGLFVTQEYEVLFKNGNFVTNADGTQESDNTAVGTSTLYDMNGNVLLRSYGPETVHFVMDPSLPFPDNIISQEITFEHGAHDGYCETLIAAIGPGATP
jgi:hypothetical protein